MPDDMPDDKTVAVRLTATNDLFKKAMLDSQGVVSGFAGNVEGQFKRISASSDRDLKTASSGVDRFASRMMSIGAATAAVGAGLLTVGFKMASTFEDVGKQVMKLQRYTGLSAEEASKLRYAAQMSAVDNDKLTRSISVMARTMENSPDKFTKIGVAVRDTNGVLRSGNDVLMDVADRYKAAGSATERLAIAQVAFGRSGADMGILLGRGADGIRALEQEAQKYGLVLTQDNLNAVQKAIDAHREFNAAVQGVQVQIGEKFLPILSSATSAFAGLIAGTGQAGASILLFGGTGLVVAGGVMTLIGQIVKMRDTFMSLSATSQTALSAVAGITAGLVVGAAMWAKYNDRVNDGKKVAEDWGKSWSDAVNNSSWTDAAGKIDEIQGKIDELESKRTSSWNPFDNGKRSGEEDVLIKLRNQAQVYQAAAIAIADSSGKGQDAAKKWLTDQLALGRVFPDVATALDAYQGKVDATAASSTDAAVAAGLMTTEQQKAADQLREQIAALQSYSQAGSDVATYMALIGNSASRGLGLASANAENLGGFMATIDDKTKSANEKLSAFNSYLKTMNDAAMGIATSKDTVQSGINRMAELAKALAGQKDGWQGSSDAAIAWRSEIRGMAGSINDVASSMVAAGKKPDEIRSALADLGQKAQDEAKRLGLPAESVQDLTDAIARVPTDITATVRTPGTEQAIEKLKELNGQMAIAALGAVGIIAVPGADGAIHLTNSLNQELGVVGEGAEGNVVVRGADGSYYAVAMVNGQLSIVAKGANAQVTADTADATRKIQDFLGLIRAIPSGGYGQGLGVLVNPPAYPGARASGGPVTAGQTYRVNEVGVEAFKSARSGDLSLLRGPYFTPQDSGTIIPAGPTSRLFAGMSTGGGGGDISVTFGDINVPNYIGDASDLQQAIAGAIADATPEILQAARAQDRSNY